MPVCEMLWVRCSWDFIRCFIYYFIDYSCRGASSLDDMGSCRGLAKVYSDYGFYVWEDWSLENIVSFLTVGSLNFIKVLFFTTKGLYFFKGDDTYFFKGDNSTDYKVLIAF
jgi:hypothetical protein